MCSILGYYNSELSSKEISMLNLELTHRGPDNSSIKEYSFRDKKLFLAHNRLAIQDLDARANQPMENTRFSIVFNGEIYNHLELRKECDGRFFTHSDTETLLVLFSKFGVAKTIQKLSGMFSIALFDKQKQKLFLIRDRVGIKPLYYTFQNSEFAFASELKGFAAHLRQNNNDKALIQFMSFGYIPAQNSWYDKIYKLEPGHFLSFDGQDVVKKKYWRLPDKQIEIGYEEAVEQLESLINNSVRQRLLSDLEVGCFLSGGVDSSLVSSVMQKNSPHQIKTFTIGFENIGYNEASYAKDVAKHIGSNHFEYMFKVDDVLSLINNFDYYYDEPFGDASALPTMLLSKFAKEKVTVALSGDGGDELFLGYDRYFITHKYYHLFRKFPQFFRRFVSFLCNNSGQDRLEKISYPLKNLTPQNLYSVISSSVKPWELSRIFSNDFLNNSFEEISFLSLLEIDNLSEKDLFDNFSRIDFYRYLCDDILTKVDRASMKYSLEARVPLLDYKIVEFAYSLPVEIKLKNGAKSILKDLLYNYIPKKIVDRPKMGFAVPLKYWFRNELKDMLYDKINSLGDKFNKQYLKKIADEHVYNNKNFEYVLWNVMRVR